ncbi:unnamed protein product [Brugia pahangi]|uniref:Rho-GAP domain-containing protein n=1 Tax=Brugia pahangi TaxID=6280 RepID=A0A0N4TLL7_BRUPA|nr:unnamed protein product [Brugia pahangi]
MGSARVGSNPARCARSLLDANIGNLQLKTISHFRLFKISELAPLAIAAVSEWLKSLTRNQKRALSPLRASNVLGEVACLPTRMKLRWLTHLLAAVLPKSIRLQQKALTRCMHG